jgi:hypothetical protein
MGCAKAEESAVATVDTLRFSKWQPFKSHRSASSLREFSHVDWKSFPTPCLNTFVGSWSSPTMKVIRTGGTAQDA